MSSETPSASAPAGEPDRAVAAIPEQVLARTRPGSRARTIVSVFAALTDELGRGATIAEVRHAFPRLAEQPPPATLTAEASSLARRQILLMTGGRASRTEYAPAGSAIASTVASASPSASTHDHAQNHAAPIVAPVDASHAPEDGALAVLQAVEALWGELGRAVSTREVAAWVKREGRRQASWNANTVRKYLETLSARRTRGAPEMRAPQVVRIAGARAASGARSAHWAPAMAVAHSPAASHPALVPSPLASSGGGVPPLVIAPRSAADALRTAIGRAQQALGRSINEEELAYWLASDAVDAAGPEMRESLPLDALTPTLSSLYRTDRRYHGRAGRVHDAWTLYTAHGGRSPYFSLGPPDAQALIQCWFEDAVAVMRVAEETRGIAAVARRAVLTQSAALDEIAATRRSALSYVLRWGCGDGRWKDVLERAEATGRQLSNWLTATPSLNPDQRDRRERWLTDRADAFRAARHVLEVFEAPQGKIPRHANSSSGVRLATLMPYLEEAAARRRVDLREAKRWLSGARRFKDLTGTSSRRFGAPATHPLSVIDRVDALRALYAVVATPKQRAILTAADQVLGHVLRDAEWLHARLVALRPHEVVARRALVVSLGLLGVLVDYEVACPDTDDPEDAAAWVFAVVLADMSNAAATLQGSGQGARGAAADVLDTACSRIAMGYALAASG